MGTPHPGRLQPRQLWDVCYHPTSGKEQMGDDKCQHVCKEPTELQRPPKEQLHPQITPETSQKMPDVSMKRVGIWTPCCRRSHLTGDKDTDGKETGQCQPWLQLSRRRAAWLLAWCHVPRDEVPTSQMSSKEEASPPGPYTRQAEG